MNKQQEKAIARFEEGFSCSQAVFSTFGEKLGLDGPTALKISQAFGGGLARMGDVCGAATGAFMAIGLKYGRIRADDDAARDKTYALVHEFVKRFKKRHGSIVCRDLIGYDLSSAEASQNPHNLDVIRTRCPGFILTACEILDEIL